MIQDWFSVWYEPAPDEHIAFISIEKIGQLGGFLGQGIPEPSYINRGNGELMRWCRLNCKMVGKPVNIRGRPAWAFHYPEDALLFKLTWG